LFLQLPLRLLLPLCEHTLQRYHMFVVCRWAECVQVPVHHSVHELLLAAEHSKPRVQSVDVPRPRIVEATIVEPTENNRL
jgi:hypothetical protein